MSIHLKVALLTRQTQRCIINMGIIFSRYLRDKLRIKSIIPIVIIITSLKIHHQVVVRSVLVLEVQDFPKKIMKNVIKVTSLTVSINLWTFLQSNITQMSLLNNLRSHVSRKL